MVEEVEVEVEVGDANLWRRALGEALGHERWFGVCQDVRSQPHLCFPFFFINDTLP